MTTPGAVDNHANRIALDRIMWVLVEGPKGMNAQEMIESIRQDVRKTGRKV